MKFGVIGFLCLLVLQGCSNIKNEYRSKHFNYEEIKQETIYVYPVLGELTVKERQKASENLLKKLQERGPNFSFVLINSTEQVELPSIEAETEKLKLVDIPPLIQGKKVLYLYFNSYQYRNYESTETVHSKDKASDKERLEELVWKTKTEALADYYLLDTEKNTVLWSGTVKHTDVKSKPSGFMQHHNCNIIDAALFKSCSWNPLSELLTTVFESFTNKPKPQYLPKTSKVDMVGFLSSSLGKALPVKGECGHINRWACIKQARKRRFHFKNSRL